VSGSLNEADTCREMVRPKLEAAGWRQGQLTYAEQAIFTDGRIVVTGSTVRRLKKCGKQKANRATWPTDKRRMAPGPIHG
jgi:type I site-specific restriction endonuclease